MNSPLRELADACYNGACNPHGIIRAMLAVTAPGPSDSEDHVFDLNGELRTRNDQEPKFYAVPG